MERISRTDSAGETVPRRRLGGSKLQGLLYQYLRDFVERQFGSAMWDRTCQRAGVPERSFLVSRPYPDRYAGDLIAGLRAELAPDAPPAEEILFEYGRHVGRCFERDFDFYFHRFVSARDMIAGIEPVIHAELRRHNPQSQPPALHTFPIPDGGLRLVYDSPRRLCDLLRGLATQVADAFGEPLSIRETSCMKRGDAACEFLLSFERTGAPRSGAFPP